MTADLSLIGALDQAIAVGSNGRRAEMLRHVTDLFIVEGATLPEVSTRFAQRTAVAGPMSNRVAA